MLQVLILVCAAGMAPQDCQKDTALDVFRGPTVVNEVMCGLHGQAYLAETSLAARGPGEYLKIKCARTEPRDHAFRAGFAGEAALRGRGHATE